MPAAAPRCPQLRKDVVAHSLSTQAGRDARLGFGLTKVFRKRCAPAKRANQANVASQTLSHRDRNLRSKEC